MRQAAPEIFQEAKASEQRPPRRQVLRVVSVEGSPQLPRRAALILVQIRSRADRGRDCRYLDYWCSNRRDRLCLPLSQSERKSGARLAVL